MLIEDRFWVKEKKVLYYSQHIKHKEQVSIDSPILHYGVGRLRQMFLHAEA